MTTPPKHRLRWYQYSLRSLFVLTVLVAIAGSWFAWKKEQERLRAAVKAIEEVGGEFSLDNGTIVAVAFRELRQHYHVRYANGEPAHRTSVVYVQDGDLVNLKKFPRLSQVELHGCHAISDAGLEHLHGLTQLQYVDLKGTNVTPEGVEKLQEALPNCKIVR